jgi:hypothetical protein
MKSAKKVSSDKPAENEKLDQFATRIALYCQKAARGMKGRDDAQIKLWEKLNLAAYRIQVSRIFPW